MFKLGALFDLGETAREVERSATQAVVGEELQKLIAGAIAMELKDAKATRGVDDRALLGALALVLDEQVPTADAAIASTAATLAAPTGVTGLLVRSWLRLIRLADRFGCLDGPDSTIDASRRYLPDNLGALVAGHTHGARIRADVTPPYFNSGTWVPVRTLPPTDLTAFLDEATASDAPLVSSPRTYVRIDLGDGPPRVAVMSDS